MSHFSVLVVGEEPLTEETIRPILQPWHEFECTGVEDEYVVDVDVTDELMELWAKPAKAVRLADGSILSRYDDKLYFACGKKDALGRPEKEFRLPEGAVEIEIPQSELSAAEGESIEKFAEDWGGWEKKADGRFYDHTNPNKKWDWWQIGGRYSERLQIKGRQGRYNQARVGDLDIKAMTAQRKRERRSTIAECCKEAGITETELEIACHEEAAAHEDWLKLSDPRPRGTEWRKWLEDQGSNRAVLAKASVCWNLPKIGTKTLDEWVESAPPLSAFAFVKDGQWVESGSMGWFGMVSDEKPAKDWEDEFGEMFRSLPADAHVAIVDCHI